MSIDYKKYEVQNHRPTKPKKPLLSSNHTAVEARQHAYALEKYEKELTEWGRKNTLYQEELKEMRGKFKKDVLKEYNLQHHKKAEFIWSFAKEYCSNEEELVIFISDLADIIYER